jgi:hypothetical protein
MIKILILPIVINFLIASVFAQEFTTVKLSTTTSLRDAMRICKALGELQWFYSLDYDDHVDSFSILRHPLTPTIKIEISASIDNGKTILALTLSESQEGMLHTGVGAYMRTLKAYANGLKGGLENLQIGAFQKGKGLAIQRNANNSKFPANHWGEYPINKADAYPSGVYEFYHLFRRNQTESFCLRLNMSKDSLYIVDFTDTLPEDKLRAQHWITMSLGRGVLSYKGNLYFMIEYPFCVPLAKKLDTFYFHIPNSMPSLYYLDRAREQEDYAAIRDHPNSVAGLSFSIIGFFAHTARARSLLQKGLKDPTHRDCYIDLDNGMIKNL